MGQWLQPLLVRLSASVWIGCWSHQLVLKTILKLQSTFWKPVKSSQTFLSGCRLQTDLLYAQSNLSFRAVLYITDMKQKKYLIRCARSLRLESGSYRDANLYTVSGELCWSLEWVKLSLWLSSKGLYEKCIKPFEQNGEPMAVSASVTISSGQQQTLFSLPKTSHSSCTSLS